MQGSTQAEARRLIADQVAHVKHEVQAVVKVNIHAGNTGKAGGAALNDKLYKPIEAQRAKYDDVYERENRGDGVPSERPQPPLMVGSRRAEMHNFTETQHYDNEVRVHAETGNVQWMYDALEEGGDPNVPNTMGCTALHLAAQNGHAGIVRALASSNHAWRAKGEPIHIDKQSLSGNTPLHLAAYGGHLAAVKALLMLDPDLEIANENDMTPQGLAVSKQFWDICEII